MSLKANLARIEGRLALPPELAGLDKSWGAQTASAPTRSPGAYIEHDYLHEDVSAGLAVGHVEGDR
jgi:hypothetical protein